MKRYAGENDEYTPASASLHLLHLDDRSSSTVHADTRVCRERRELTRNDRADVE